MGNTLSMPQNSIGIEKGCRNNTSYAIGEMQGYRGEMEDAYLISFSLPDHPSYSLFGVFDGHCHDHVSNYLSDNLSNEVNKLDNLTNQNIIDLIVKLDTDYNLKYEGKNRGGSTIILALVETGSEFPYKAHIFNCGDSRCFQYDSVKKEFKSLSIDHSPALPKERERIEAAGGVVGGDSGTARVDHELAMSRAFGDSQYKRNSSLSAIEQKVIALCEVQETEINQGDYLYLTCDGIFETVTWEDVFRHMNDSLMKKDKVKKDPLVMVKELLSYAQVKKSRDNMTAMCLYFKTAKDIPEKQIFDPADITLGLDEAAFISGYFDMASKYHLSGKEAIKEGMRKWMDKNVRELNLFDSQSEDRVQFCKDRLDRLEVFNNKLSGFTKEHKVDNEDVDAIFEGYKKMFK